MNEIMVNGTTSIEGLKDKNLQAAAKRIIKASEDTRKSLFRIAYELNRIDGRQLYKKDGFKNITDCATALFGYKKAMTNNLVRIARNYIDAANPVCVLPSGQNADGIPVAAEWTVGQLQEVLSLDTAVVAELVNNGTLNATMSAKAIRAAVKAYKNGGTDADTDGETLEIPEGNIPPADVGETDTDMDTDGETPTDAQKAHITAIEALKRLFETLPEGSMDRENVGEMLDSLRGMTVEW